MNGVDVKTAFPCLLRGSCSVVKERNFLLSFHKFNNAAPSPLSSKLRQPSKVNFSLQPFLPISLNGNYQYFPVIIVKRRLSLCGFPHLKGTRTSCRCSHWSHLKTKLSFIYSVYSILCFGHEAGENLKAPTHKRQKFHLQ